MIRTKEDFKEKYSRLSEEMFEREVGQLDNYDKAAVMAALITEQAKKLIREVDKDRASYYRYYTDQIWGDIDCYDLCVNVGRVGVEGAVQTIAGYAKAIS